MMMLDWHNVKIEYCDFSFVFVLEGFTIKITYFDSDQNAYDTLYIPAKKKTFYEIMSLAKI